ncbi:MAG: MMPL family transporter, partial [Patescibacteria group bacterium]
FMLLAYRLPGLIAVIALILFTFLNLLLYKFFDVTITLAGIAGLVLSIGIAVDANVLIFERLKEEFAAGRDYDSAVHEAFVRAWPAIRDGHFTTLISAVVLYWFSTSFIRGFALTLAIGVVLSLFTAITVSRSYLNNTLAWKWARNPVLLALKKK